MLQTNKLALFMWSGLTLLAMLPLLGQAQSAELLDRMRLQYPQEKAVYLSNKEEVTINLVGDSLQVSARLRQEMLHLTDQSVSYAREKVFTSYFSKVRKIEAQTLVPAKKGYKPVKVDNFSEKFEMDAGIFYDDSRSISFSYPAVQPGAQTVLDYTLDYSDPRFMHSYYVGSFVPVVQSQLTVSVPKGLKLSYKVMHGEKAQVKFTTQDKGKYTLYSWTAQDVPAFTREEEAPKPQYTIPHIIYYVEEAPGVRASQQVLGKPADLHRMYRTFIDQAKLGSDPRLQLVVDSLVSGVSSEEEKVRRIFYWVQDNIKYVAFEDGLRGFVPHKAGLVYEKRYGDCKDMASIIHQMLQEAGIKTAYLTWIGTRDLPYKYSEVATPLVDNHMITTYVKDGTPYFLDATSKHTRFGLPSSMIQGKEALLTLGPDKFQILTVPVIQKETNRITDTFSLQIEGNHVIGKGQMSLAGYPKIHRSYHLQGLDQVRESRYVTNLLAKGSNKYFVPGYKIHNLLDKEAPLTVDYTYRLEDYVKSVDNEVFVNMNLDRTYFNDLIDPKKRTQPRENDFTFSTTQQVELEIPAGYEVAYMPGNSSLANEVFGYEIKYARQGNKIVQQKDLYVNYLLLEPNHFEDWNAVVRKLSEAYREVLILKKLKS